jgi:hypothetical protein
LVLSVITAAYKARVSPFRAEMQALSLSLSAHDARTMDRIQIDTFRPRSLLAAIDQISGGVAGFVVRRLYVALIAILA